MSVSGVVKSDVYTQLKRVQSDRKAFAKLIDDSWEGVLFEFVLAAVQNKDVGLYDQLLKFHLVHEVTFSNQMPYWTDIDKAVKSAVDPDPNVAIRRVKPLIEMPDSEELELKIDQLEPADKIHYKFGKASLQRFQNDMISSEDIIDRLEQLFIPISVNVVEPTGPAKVPSKPITPAANLAATAAPAVAVENRSLVEAAKDLADAVKAIPDAAIKSSLKG